MRGDGVAPKTFVGPAGALASLTTQAAEHVYANPNLRVGVLPAKRGPLREGDRVLPVRIRSGRQGGPTLSPQRLGQFLSNTGGSPREALALYRAAVTLKPDFWIGYNNVMNSLWVMGDEESAWRTGEEMRKLAGGRPGRAPELQYQNWDTLTWNLQAWLASSVADAELNAGIGTGVGSSGLNDRGDLRAHARWRGS